jgi:uncharacterized repeat protein (TIGR03803 family)
MTRTFLRLCLALPLLGLAAPAAQAIDFATLHTFVDRPDGVSPTGAVVAVDGVLYGTTARGGTADLGTIYRVDPATGAEQVVHSFGTSPDGSAPTGALAVIGHVLYGTTPSGGAHQSGVAFAFDTDTGVETVLHTFGSHEDGGFQPEGGLTAAGGLLFGTNQVVYGAAGNVFRIDPANGHYRVLYAFTNRADGGAPLTPVVEHGGILYGTTSTGGAFGGGTLYALSRPGVLTVLYNFPPEATVLGRLVYRDGLLYGTTAYGGSVSPACDNIGCGTIFQVDATTGAELDLYVFTSPDDGAFPNSGVVWRDGQLLGTTVAGGARGDGTVFAFDLASGTKSTLHAFRGGAGGYGPNGLLVDGPTVYGTTSGSPAILFEMTP